MSIPRILIVDDDHEMRSMMTEFLQQNAILPLPASCQAEVATHLAAGRVDLILLDVMLGDESGLDICRKIRADQDVPIIIISALSADHQRMQGYEVGADDYIAKPFNPELLLARIKAVLARTRRTSSIVYRRKTMLFHFDGWSHNAKRDETLSPTGVQVALSHREKALLQTFLAHPHIPLTREEIAAALDMQNDQDNLSAQEGAGRSIDVLVGRLRSKIESNPKAPKYLKTARGVGYVFAVDVQTEK